jgi:hypothetical protein
VSGGPANWCAGSQVCLFWACVLRSARLTAGSCWRADGGVLMRLLAIAAVAVPALVDFRRLPGTGIAWRSAMRRRGRRSAARLRAHGARSPSAGCVHDGCGGVLAMSTVPKVGEQTARGHVTLAAGWQGPGSLAAIGLGSASRPVCQGGRC